MVEIVHPPTYPVARLMALYARAGQDAHEYFTERCGIYIFDGGQDEEYACNQAHRETVEFLQRAIAHLTQDEIEITRQINIKERDTRRRGINPGLMPSTELSELESAMLAAELLARSKGDEAYRET